MAKSGRPKKPGARYRCGKRTIQQRQEDAREVAIEARMRVFGVSKEIAALAEMGSPLGRLLHWKVITNAQADAGYDFAVTMRDYLATAQLQRPTQGKAGFVPSQRTSSEQELDPAETAKLRGRESKARAYMEALAEIDRTDPFSGPTSTSVVWDVCVNENDREGEAAIGALRVGLNAIHRVLYGRKAA